MTAAELYAIVEPAREWWPEEMKWSDFAGHYWLQGHELNAKYLPITTSAAILILEGHFSRVLAERGRHYGFDGNSWNGHPTRIAALTAAVLEIKG